MAVDITALYCCVDDFCKVFADWEAHRLLPSEQTRQRSGKLSRAEMLFIVVLFHLSPHLVAWIGGTGALRPTRVPGYAMRTYFGRPSSSIRFSTSTAMATSLACRPSVCERSPSPMTRFHLEMSASTRARLLYPDTLCQPIRPRSARHRRWASRCVGAVSAVSLGTAFARGGTTTAAAGWRVATSA